MRQVQGDNRYVPSLRAIRVALQYSLSDEACCSSRREWVEEVHEEVIFKDTAKWWFAESNDSDHVTDINLHGVVVVADKYPEAYHMAPVRETLEFELLGTSDNLVLCFKCFADQFNRMEDIMRDMLYSLGMSHTLYEVSFDQPHTTLEHGTRIAVTTYRVIRLCKQNAAWVESNAEEKIKEHLPFYTTHNNAEWLRKVGYDTSLYAWNCEFHDITSRQLIRAYCDMQGINKYKLGEIPPIDMDTSPIFTEEELRNMEPFPDLPEDK